VNFRYRSYECPVCHEWIEILPTTNLKDFQCPWCWEHLRMDEEMEFRDGLWRDLSKLVTKGSHWDE